jgi:poly(3-hydroxybutyrate) depolymerase
MKRLACFLAITLVSSIPAAPAAQQVGRHTLEFEGKIRNYFLFAPEASPAGATPLVLLLHGSGRDGNTLIGPWQNLAKKHGFAIVAPDARDRAVWDMFPDGPDFLHAVIEAVKGQTRIDPRRVYLFGHSAGGHHGLGIALLESEYFAAVAVHAGVLNDMTITYTARARRKIPIALWQGSRDPVVPAQLARATELALTSRGFPATLTEVPGHTHDYYGRSSQINDGVWTFFERHRLASDPVFEKHQFVR